MLKKIIRSVCISVVLTLLLVGGYYAYRFYVRSRIEAELLESLEICDEIVFSEERWWEDDYIDEVGLNAETFDTKRRIVRAMIETGEFELSQFVLPRPPDARILLKKDGETIFSIDLRGGCFVVGDEFFCVDYKGDSMMSRIFGAERSGEPTEISEKADKVLDACDNIEFESKKWKEKTNIVEFIDADGLNAESIDYRKKAIKELFSAGEAIKDAKENEEFPHMLYSGRIFFKKGGRVLMIIKTYSARGYRINGQAFRVDPTDMDKYDTIKRILKFFKKTDIPDNNKSVD